MFSGLLTAILAGATLALVSAAHCAVMCGPLALSARARGGAHVSLSYFAGRLASYTILGALAGSVARAALLSPFARWAEALLAWTLAATLLYAGVSALRPGARPLLVKLGKSPRVDVLGRMIARVADDPLLLGAATALLPCGALFAAVAAAAALGSPLAGALAMAAFATVTGAAVLGVAQLGGLVRRGPWVKRAIGVALLAGAAIMIYRPLPLLVSTDGVPACHAAPGAQHAGASR